MTESQLAEILGRWKGYEIDSVERREENGRAQVWLWLRPVAGLPMVCSGCGERRLSIHDTEERWIPELPIRNAECASKKSSVPELRAESGTVGLAGSVFPSDSAHGHQRCPNVSDSSREAGRQLLPTFLGNRQEYRQDNVGRGTG